MNLRGLGNVELRIGSAPNLLQEARHDHRRTREAGESLQSAVSPVGHAVPAGRRGNVNGSVNGNVNGNFKSIS